MSQSYHCQLQESVTVDISLGDTVTHRLNLTEILPLEEMKSLLRQQLREHGFSEDGERFTHTAEVTTVVDLDAMEVTLTRRSEKQLATTAAATGRGYSQAAARDSAPRELSAAVRQAQQHLESEGARLQREETAAVEAADMEMKARLHAVLQQVYTESLKRKARQLGDVRSVHESTSASGEYELIIQIEQ